MKMNSIVILAWLGLFSVAVFMLTGCTNAPTKIIRVTEYAAESPLMSSATVGGCTVESSDEPPVLSMTYTGDKCQVTYDGSP